MRVAFTRTAPPVATHTVPCDPDHDDGDRGTEDAATETAATETAASTPRRGWLDALVPMAPGTPLERAMARLFDIDPADESTLAVELGERIPLSETEAKALDGAFARATARVDDELEQLMASGYRHEEQGETEQARRAYLAANVLLEREVSSRRALVQVSLGELERARGNHDHARAWLNRALAMAPDHIAALRGRATLASETDECATAADMLGRLVQRLDDPNEKVDVLGRVARESLRAAEQAIQQALQLRPSDRDLLESLHAVYTAAENWDAAVSVGVQLAEAIPERRERARALVAAAKLCSHKAHNLGRAVALFEAAIEDDPEVPEAFAALEDGLRNSSDHTALAAAYRRQCARLALAGAEEAERTLLRKLGELLTQTLRDVPRAVETYERLVTLDTRDLEARLSLSALYAGHGQTQPAIEQLERAARLAPSRSETYRQLKALFERDGDPDRAFLAASVLVALGEADINEQLSYTRHASAGLLGFEGRFDDRVWNGLAEASHPFNVDAIAQALEPAAIALWMNDNRERGISSLPDKKHLEKAKQSTVSAVRCFTWASRLLDVPEPAMYLQPDNAEVGVGILPSAEHALLLGRTALSGRSLSELVFMATRQLCYARPCWRLLACWSDPADLAALLWAGIAAARPELSASLPGRGQTLRPKLLERLRPEALDGIRSASESIAQGTEALDVYAWARSVEQIACRAAFLASGDVSVAAPVLAVTGAPPGGLSAAERARDLLPFAVSKPIADLRRYLAVAVR